MNAYVWFDPPQSLPIWLDREIATELEPFSLVVGHTHFGDLLLRNDQTSEFAVFLQGTGTLFDTGYFDEREFRTGYLAHPEIVESVLRPGDISAVEQRLGVLSEAEVFIPVPIPALGGSDGLETYVRGSVGEYLSFVRQSLGVARNIRGG